MAGNIFNPLHFDLVTQRIGRLTNQSPRQWGKMNLCQMLKHCSIQLEKALAISPETKTNGPAIFRTVFGRWMAMYAIPWPKGSNTPAAMNMEINGQGIQSFENEKAQLLQLLKQVQQKESFGVHPFFGALNKKDWGRLIWKHLDHHLRQFGQ